MARYINNPYLPTQYHDRLYKNRLTFAELHENGPYKLQSINQSLMWEQQKLTLHLGDNSKQWRNSKSGSWLSIHN